MNRPPDNDFYNSTTENSNFPGQPGNQPQPAFPPPQGPMSRPGFGPPPSTPNAPQGPMSRPGFGPPPNTPNAPQGPMSRPGFGPPPSTPNAPQGPMSRPGFGPPPNTPMPGNYPQSAATVPATPWGPPPGGPANFPNQLPPQPPKRSLKFILLLAATLILLTVLIIGGGTLVLLHKGKPVVPPTTTATTAAGATATVTIPAFNSIGKPVKAGTVWIVTLTGAKTSNTSLITPNKLADTYLEVSLSFKNVTRKPVGIIGTSNFTLSDPANHFYSESFTDTNVRTLPGGNVNPNQTLNFQIAYEVPKTQRAFLLYFTYDTAVSGATIAWKFTV